MKTYKVLTPDVGMLKGAAWRKQRFIGTVVGEGRSVGGVSLLKVKISPKTKHGSTDRDVDIGKGDFSARNKSNNPTVFYFQQKWWVRAKRARRVWKTALELGSHVICHTNLTLTKENARIYKALGQRPSFVATWIPCERQNRKDGSFTVILYEVQR